MSSHHLQARIFSCPVTYFVLSFLSPSPKPQAGSRPQQSAGFWSLCHHFSSWRIQRSSCSSHHGHKPSTQMGHPHFGYIMMCEQPHGRKLTAHSSRLPEVSVIYCSQKVCYSSHASKECLKCKSAAENASFHYPFDSKFKFYGAQLSKPCLWGSSKTNFINVHTQTSFAALVQTFKKTQGYQHPFILRCCTSPCIHILTIINKPSSPAIIMKQTFPHPMQILGWQKIPFSNLQGELSKEN